MISFNKKHLAILFYFLIALTSSVVFRYDIFDVFKKEPSKLLLGLLYSLLEGIGPFIGALVIIKIFKTEPTITLTGHLKKRGILMLLIPIILLSLMGMPNSKLNPHLYGFVVGIWIFVYGVLEETGWRGFLQEALGPLKPLIKYTIVGVFWYLWHLTFLGKNTTFLNEVFIALLLIFSSWGIGYIVDKTKSVIVAACFHITGNIMGLSSIFSEGLSIYQRLGIVILSVGLWILIIRKSTSKPITIQPK